MVNRRFLLNVYPHVQGANRVARKMSHDRGLSILAFLCNQFAKQGSTEDRNTKVRINRLG